MQRSDTDGLMRAITDASVEAQVLERVELKARTYGQGRDPGGSDIKIAPEVVVRIYRDWIIPFNKKVQMLYLLERPLD